MAFQRARTWQKNPWVLIPTRQLTWLYVTVVIVQTPSRVWPSVSPWTAACQASLSLTISWSLPSSCPLNWWRHTTISSSVAHFSHLQYFPASSSFPMSWLFVSGGKNIGDSASATVLPINTYGWFPLGLTGLISWQSIRLCVSSTTIRKHQLFSTSLLYGPALTSVHDYWKNHSFDYMDFC